MADYIRCYKLSVEDESLCDDLIEWCDRTASENTNNSITNFNESYRQCTTFDLVEAPELLQRLRAVLFTMLDKYAKDIEDVGYINGLTMIEAPRVLRYEPDCGHFHTHADNWNFESALRQLSVVLYLNDVDEGGETTFIHQNKTITPKKGRLAFFPPFFTHLHKARPPRSSRKYAMVTWFTFPNLVGKVGHYLTI